MSTIKVAKRYAQGLLEYTKEIGNTELIFNEMKDVAKTITDSKELQSFFATPIIDGRKKQGITKEIFSAFSPITKNMIALVIKQGRERFLGDIVQEYIKGVEALNGIQKIILTTAEELSSESIEKIVKASSLVDQAKGYQVKIIIKPELIGGYILRIGDKQIDNSVKNQLSNLRKEFQLN